MNTLVNLKNGTYELTLENGQTYICKRWLEKKADKQMWHVIIPKEAREECGRTYIRESYFENTDIYQFENKTEHRTGMGDGGWKSRLTPEELEEYQSHEQRMEELKKLALSRPVKVLTEEEKLKREIEKIRAKLVKMGVEV
jgi:pyruvate-formate lyase